MTAAASIARPSAVKRVRSGSDLALNGAPPAYSECLHVGRPNIGDESRFLDLTRQMLARRMLTNNGPYVQELERKLADWLGVKHVVAMCNGTVALEIAIRASGLQGEVILPSYTFVATAQALHWQGITPVFADIDPATHNLDPCAVERMITPRTTGIIGVHVWGRPAPVEALQDIADRRGLALMFDAAHALGCAHRGKMIGGFGRAEVFSFHATKFFNCFEGGCVTTDDDALATAMRYMRNFGFEALDKAVYAGVNGKMPEVCAAMGLTNFDFLPTIVATNRHHHSSYLAAFEGIDGVSIMPYDNTETGNYQYVIAEVSDDCPATRDELVDALHAENILARKYFWPGCHNMKPFRELYPHAGMLLPNTEKVARRVIVLPTGTALPGDAVETIAGIVSAVVESARQRGGRRG